MLDCFDCQGNGQYGIARDGQPLVCPTCKGSGVAPAPTLSDKPLAWDPYGLEDRTRLRLLP